MNKVFESGRLTGDPVITQGNTAVARYTLAVDGYGDRTDFIKCVAFGKSAEFAEKYLKKGMKILLEGRIQTGSYKDKDGKTVYTTDVVVESHEFCESKKEDKKEESTDFMNIPDGMQEELPFL